MRDDDPTAIEDGTTHGAVPSAPVRSVLRDTTRQDLLVEYGRRLGRDPSFAALDDDEVEHRLRTGSAEIAAATCRWLELLAEFVVRGVWSRQDAATPADWLSWAVGMAPSTAREHVRVALRLRECPLVRQRFATGRLSYSKVRAITRVCEPATEPFLLTMADAAPAAVLERIVADTRRLERSSVDTVDRDDLGATRRWLDDGTFEVTLRMDAATGMAVDQHLDRLLETDAPSGRPTPPDDDLDVDHDHDHDAARPSRRQRTGDVVVAAIAQAVAGRPVDTSGADRHLVVLHAEAADVLAAAMLGDARSASDDRHKPAPTGPAADGSAAQLVPTAASAATAAAPSGGASGGASRPPPPDASAGTDPTAAWSSPAPPAVVVRDGRGRIRAMSARQLWRLACAARLDLSVESGGHPADLGRAQRRPDARLRRLLAVRDRDRCQFPGCSATLFLHAHHVRHWAAGGPTDLDNLVLLCTHHHRVVHDRSLRLDRGPDGWRVIEPVPTVAGAAVGVAVGRHRDRWQDDDARTVPHARPLPGGSADALRRAVAAHLPTDVLRSLQPRHWDGGPYDHDLTVSLLAQRLALAA